MFSNYAYDANNSAKFRQDIESSLGTIANGMVYVAPSLCDEKHPIDKYSNNDSTNNNHNNNTNNNNSNNNTKPHVQDKAAINKKRKRSIQDDQVYLNLGLFAGKEFKAGDYISFYGAEYFDCTKVNNNELLQQKVDTSNYVMKINRQRLVDGQDWALLMNRKRIKTDGDIDIAPSSCKYYTWEDIPQDIKEQLQLDKSSYQLKYQQMMNGGAGLFCNQVRSYLPHFGQWVHQLFTKWGNWSNSTAAKRSLQALVSVGINCIFVPIYTPHCSSTGDDTSTTDHKNNASKKQRIIYDRRAKLVGKDRCTKCMHLSKPCDSAEMVVLLAITTIKPDTELITYYGAHSSEEHEKFFQ